MRIKQKKHSGFTLTEKLIIIGIIGVLTSMTINSLTHKNDKYKYVSSFKKNYSVLSEAFYYAIENNGKISKWDWSNRGNAYNNIENYVFPYLNILKNCKEAEGCIPYKWYYANGNYWYTPDDLENEYKFILTDGTAVSMNVVQNCIENGTECLNIHLDTNGAKGPNRSGKDIFNFHLYPYTNDIQPSGLRLGYYNSDEKNWPELTNNVINTECTSGTGLYCGAKIILDGYKINY